MDKSLKRPKPRNAKKTREKILLAAQKSFSEHGYAQSGIRDIAAMADISSPMLLRYFGSKAGLFEAALRDAMQVERLLEAERSTFGEYLAGLLTDRTLDVKAPSLVALSTGHADARAIVTRALDQHIIEPLAEWLGPPQAHSRALEIAMLGMGFVLFTQQFPLAGRSNAADKKMAAWLALSVQAIVDQS